MEELNDEVQMVRNNTVNAKSKTVYLYGIIKYVLWLHDLKPGVGKKPGKSLYGSMRSSIFHLYRLYDVQMPDNYDNELRKFFKGLKRSVITESK
ncbi:hypothetical protein L914_00178 [Phytophthora nicotianae]|uniref:Uncharacterized protein n=1 Tax=Phytophthora nicotianae TaxID=4792 RepID=W2P9N2_PHYNI|nr:hypothetical protein L914_00178 [Phytophthora nicotianae]